MDLTCCARASIMVACFVARGTKAAFGRVRKAWGMANRRAAWRDEQGLLWCLSDLEQIRPVCMGCSLTLFLPLEGGRTEGCAARFREPLKGSLEGAR